MKAADTAYESYLQDEWQGFAGDPDRQRQALAGAGGLPVERLLDAGCGAGQEMIPFARAGARCVGIDISPGSGAFGLARFRAHHPDLAVHFVTATAEEMPLAAESFDVVLCRVAIPYTDNRQAFAEMARVLRPGGVLLLKTHHARYYVQKFVDGLRRRSPLFSIHALRVLASGFVFWLTGRQPAGGMLLRESFLTTGMLGRELSHAGLAIDAALPDWNPATPSYRIRKSSTQPDH